MQNNEEFAVKKNIDLYMLNDEDEEASVCCDRCAVMVNDVSELYPYFEILVCDNCLDKLRLRDEKESLELESDGMIEYDT